MRRKEHTVFIIFTNVKTISDSMLFCTYLVFLIGIHHNGDPDTDPYILIIGVKSYAIKMFNKISNKSYANVMNFYRNL